MGVSTAVPRRVRGGFRHEAVIYRGVGSMVAKVLPFIKAGIEAGEPILVAVPADRIIALEEALGPDSGHVTFADMPEVGRNPACIIPVWRAFVDDHAGHGSVRGIGEPVYEGRRTPELAECRLHEALLNVAFDGGADWQLLCPYDADQLPAEVIADVAITHPFVADVQTTVAGGYRGHPRAFEEFSAPLPAPPDRATAVGFGLEDLQTLRTALHLMCADAKLSAGAADDLVLAAHEVATNSIRHGGGRGTLRTWTEPDAVVVEVNDSGLIGDPLVGRDLESGLSESGRGLWMANQLCDLVQVRSSARGTAVRLYAWR